MCILIDRSGRVNPALIELASKRGLNVREDISLDGMNACLQNSWIQKGKFRFQIQGNTPDRGEIDLLKALGCIDAISASGHHDGALLLGTILTRFRIRVEFLIKECSRGIDIDSLFLLGSKRPLEDWEKSGLGAEATCLSEIEMMERVVMMDQILSKWKIVTVKTDDVPLYGAGYRHANTGDTFARWKEVTNYREGSFIICSNQPFVHYQTTNARRILGQNFDLFGIGDRADTSLPIQVFLDNLAKQFYEEKLFVESSVD